jgi:hypothetical protein
MARKPAVPSERVREALWLVRRAAGSDAQVHRWLKEYPVPKREVGAPRNTSFDAVLMPDGGPDFFLRMMAEHHGPDWDEGRMIVPPPDDPNFRDFRGGKRASTPHAVLRRYVEAIWRHHEKMHRELSSAAAKTNDPETLKAAKAYDPQHLGTSIEQVTRRLAKQLKELRKKRRS